MYQELHLWRSRYRVDKDLLLMKRWIQTHSLRFSPKRSSPSPSSSSLGVCTASMSLMISSASEKGAGGEDGGNDDSESRLIRGGGEDPGNGELVRLRLPLAPDWKSVSKVQANIWGRYHILSWVNAIKLDGENASCAIGVRLDASDHHVTIFFFGLRRGLPIYACPRIACLARALRDYRRGLH